MRYLKRDVLRLAMTYLGIIMVMSIGFSVIFYHIASHELGRRPRGMVPESRVPDGGSLQQYLDEREQESNEVLLIDLVLVNTITFIVGGLLSYLLAEKTLRPIEDNMEAQAQFVSDASHELRTPLTALRTANEVALRNKKLTLLDAKQVIIENVDDIARLQALTDSMLGLLRDDDPDQVCQRVSLQLVVGEAINLVAPQALNQEIIIEDSVGKLEVKGNEQRLIQLVTILLDNAIKYSPKQSTVFISSTKKGKTTILCVRDEGIGMSEATKSAIFTRFYRADESRSTTPGYGLGMAIAKKIVDAHGGKIGIDSEPNKGSTVTIHLPSAI